MTYGPEELIWDGETCFHCGKDLHGKAIQYKDMYFCSEECFGAHLVEEHEDDVDYVDFITQGEIDERMREIHDDQMRDK